MNKSLFEHLDNPLSTITLTLQYRMNKTVTNLANALTYKGQLLCADDSIAYAVLRLPKKERLLMLYKEEQWIVNVLDTDVDNAVIGIDTGPTWMKFKRGEHVDLFENLKVPVRNTQEDEVRMCDNICEVAVVYTIVQALKEVRILFF